MNATLTGFGVALVLALLAALVGPLFVDWSSWRPEFEAAASRALGSPVRVLGDVQVRLLPKPRVRFAEVVVGEEKGPRLEANRFALDLATTPLMKGEYRITDLTIASPRLTATLAADGRLILPFTLRGLNEASGEEVAIERLEIQDGRAEILDEPTGTKTVLENISAGGEAVSMLGPFKLEGRFTREGEAYGLRLGTGRFDRYGAARIKLTVEPKARPLSFELDGIATLGTGAPRFEGMAVLARPAPKPEEGALATPWRVSGKLKADARHVVVETLDLQHGTDERALKLIGSAEFNLGAERSGSMVLQARQLDLDRSLGVAKDAPPPTPANAVQALMDRFPLLVRPPFPVRASVAVEGVVLSGDILQGFALDVEASDRLWAIERFDVKLPGGGRLRSSGNIGFSDKGPAFGGAVSLETPDLPSLVHWMEGTGDGKPKPDTAVRRLALSGEVDARPDAISVQRLSLSADGETVRGRLGYAAGESRARLSADLSTEALDLDRLELRRLLNLAGLGDRKPEGAADLELKLAAKSVTAGGVSSRGVDVDLTTTPGALEVRKLQIEDLGGAQVDASGRLALTDGRASGKLEARIDAKKLDGIVAALRAAGVDAAFVDGLASRADALVPAALAGVIGSDGGTSGGLSLLVQGIAGGSTVDMRARAGRLDVAAPLEVTATIGATEAATLMAQLGVRTMPVETLGPASAELSVQGVPKDGAALKFDLKGQGGKFGLRGRLLARGDGEVAAVGDAELALEDIGRYAVIFGRAPPGTLPALPVALAGRVEFGTMRAAVQDLKGVFAGRAVSGRLAADKAGLSGDLSIDRVSASELVGLAIGPLAFGPGASGAAASVWPAGPVAPGVLTGANGRIAVTAGKLSLPSGYEAEQARFAINLRPSEVSVDGLSATLAGGRLSGQVELRRAEDEAALALRLRLEQARMGAFSWSRNGQPVVDGAFSAALDLQGSGRSLAAIMSSLSGGGSLSLSKGGVRGLAPSVFDRIMAAADQGLPLEVERLRPFVEAALAGGELPVEEATGAFTVASGTLRMPNVAVKSAAASVLGAATLDLGTLTLAAELSLAPAAGTSIAIQGARPQIALAYQGPLASPQVKTDVTALTSFLTVRTLDREMKRVEKIEADRRERERQAREEEVKRLREAEDARKRAEEEARRKAEEDAKRRTEVEDDGKRANALPPLEPPREVRPAPAIAPAPPPAGPIIITPPQQPQNLQAPRSPNTTGSTRPATPGSQRAPGEPLPLAPVPQPPPQQPQRSGLFDLFR